MSAWPAAIASIVAGSPAMPKFMLNDMMRSESGDGIVTGRVSASPALHPPNAATASQTHRMRVGHASGPAGCSASVGRLLAAARAPLLDAVGPRLEEARELVIVAAL